MLTIKVAIKERIFPSVYTYKIWEIWEISMYRYIEYGKILGKYWETMGNIYKIYIKIIYL
jgi:hypothetical protein